VMVRVHLQDALADMLPVASKVFGWPLRDALKRIASEEKGVAIVLRQPEGEKHLVERIKSLDLEPEVEAEKDASGKPEDLRNYGIGAQILADLGVHRMRLLSAPKKFHALGGFDLEVVEYIWEEV